VVHRERLTLVGATLPRQAYHAVAEGGAPRTIISEVEQSAREVSACEVLRVAEWLECNGFEVICAGVPAGWQPLPASLDAILASHTLLHSAEGELYRDCLAEACLAADLEVSRFAQRELLPAASAAIGITADQVESHTSGMGRLLGPPWQKDHREAAAAAWLALANSRGAHA
jgi:hypothetical protein